MSSGKSPRRTALSAAEPMDGGPVMALKRLAGDDEVPRSPKPVMVRVPV